MLRPILKMDILKYFDSVCHETLLAQLGRRFKDPRLIDLFGRIVASHESCPGRCLPIGSLTSQHFASAYLVPLDRLVKETLRCRAYVRYAGWRVLPSRGRPASERCRKSRETGGTARAEARATTHAVARATLGGLLRRDVIAGNTPRSWTPRERRSPCAAQALINQTLDEALAEQEGDFDADSRWVLTWFEQSGFAEGEYGVAEQLSKSKNTSVAGMVEAGILESARGKVRLLRPEELPAG